MNPDPSEEFDKINQQTLTISSLKPNKGLDDTIETLTPIDGIFKQTLINLTSEEKKYDKKDLEQLLENEYIVKRFNRISRKLCATRKHFGMGTPEDIRQEISLRIIEKINTFRGEASFTTWVERIAINIVITRFNETKKRNEVSLENESINNEELANQVDFTSDINNQLDMSLIKTTINKLPPKMQKAIWQHFFEGKSFREMAKENGKGSPQTQANYVRKAIEMLRNLLKINLDRTDNI